MSPVSPRHSLAFASACAALLIGAPALAAEALTPAAAEAAIAATCARCTYVWKGVQIAPPRPASIGEIAAAGLPPHVVVYPVRATYTQNSGFKRDFTWNYYVYKDDFGGWAAQSNATPGNTESDPY